MPPLTRVAPAPPAGGRVMADKAGLRIGLLGGSFNPAHAGHVHISRLALRSLRLHEVWWLVSPQNPLKPVAGMAPLDERMARAAEWADGERIVVTDIEARLSTRYTADTLRALRVRYRRTRFVWLMGADNLAQIHRWQEWTSIFETVPIAVFDRPTYSHGALAAKAARRFADARIRPSRAPGLAGMEPPAWVFLRIPLHPASATRIRAGDGRGREPSGTATAPAGSGTTH